ncbi:MAG: LacI family DNA-binding transcriptional regulator [Victivallales bacterium]
MSDIKLNGYVAVAKELREGILSGKLRPKDRLSTLRDISKRFGISHNTAQRVISELKKEGYVECYGRHGSFVSDKWRESSTAAIEKHAPVNLGIIVPGRKENAFSRQYHLYQILVKLFETRLYEEGGSLKIFPMEGYSPDSAVAREISDSSIDALLMLTDFPVDSSVYGKLQERKIPCICFSRTVGTESLFTEAGYKGNSILVDDFWAFRKITGDLAGMGHERIAFVGMPSGKEGVLHWNNVRLAAYKMALKENNIRSSDDDIYLVEGAEADKSIPENIRYYREMDGKLSVNQRVYGYAAAMKMKEGYTAVVCSNDNIALGVIEGLEQKGRRVPDDVSVTGYDNMPEEEIESRLTTFGMPYNKVIDCVFSIIDRSRGAGAPWDRASMVLDPVLVSRNSWKRIGRGESTGKLSS